MSKQISQAVKDALSAAIETWADEVLVGRPAVLGYAVYQTMERTLRAEQAKIEALFPTEVSE